jgi:hypothetical protein
MRKLVFGLSLLLGACSGGGKLADIAAKFGIGGAKDCGSAVSAEASAPPKAVSDEATKAPAIQPEQAVAKAPDVLPPPTTAEGRRLARMAASAAAAVEPASNPPVEAELKEVAVAEVAPPPPVHRHHRQSVAAVPVAVSRKVPAPAIDNHDHFSDSTAPSEYRLPVSAQVLVPREGQTVLNGPRHEGVAPPNTDPVRISQN